MSGMEVDDTIDTQDGGGVDTAVMDGGDAGDGDNYSAMQERMAGDDSPWYSPSEGKVVTPNGEVVLDPETGLPYESMEAFEQAQQKLNATTAKPKTEPAQAEKSMSKKFENFLSPDGQVSTDSLFELSKAAEPFGYQNELVPPVIEAQQGQQGAQQQDAPIDPMQRVEQRREELHSAYVSPIEGIYNDLLQHGVKPEVANELLGKYYNAQKAIVDKEYKAEYDKALQELIDNKTKPVLGSVQEKELMAKSEANINTLASKLYPNGGKDAFFALVNGTYNEKGEFERGPASRVLDMMVKMASNGKQFSSSGERDKAYKDTFLQLTSDPVMAREFMVMAHNYWLGTQIKNVYQQGKQSAAQESQRIQRTVKTRPASFAAPSTESATAGMPEMLKAVMGGMSR